MLGKLVKQEIKESSKLLLLSHGFLIIFSIISGILMQFAVSTDFLQGDAIVPKVLFALFLIVNGILIIASSFGVMIYIAIRFYKNLFTDQGYLMFTLPTTSSQLLHSKIITGVLWTLFNSIIIWICMGIILLPLLIVAPIEELWRELQELLQLVPTSTIITLNLLSIVSVLFAPLYEYACICLGQLFNKSRIIFAVIFYGVGMMILQFVLGVISLVSTFNSAMTNSTLYTNTYDDAAFLTLQFESMTTVYLATIVAMILVTILSYFLCQYIMKKKLNLL